MAEYTLKFLPSGKEITVPEGTTIYHAALSAGLYIDAPCGGEGLCGGCTVGIREENGAEREVLSCQHEVHGGMTVLLKGAEGHRILENGADAGVSFAPTITRRGRDILCDGLKTAEFDPGRPIYAAAFDIGTTTVVCYLVSLDDGKDTAVASMLNPQSKYGADVISRANYAKAGGAADLTASIRGAMNELLGEVCKKAGADREQIFLITAVGNTCMHHLLMGISTDSLIVAPYEAATVDPIIVPAAAEQLEANPDAMLMVLPNISGFVGADTVGAILASRMDVEEPLTLLIDIGTNGEMALGNREHLCTCSTAAGPAFEGALISCGMRGADGAIDHVRFSGGSFEVSVIGGGRAEGICGSGLIDAIAGLVENGVIDETGKLLTPDEAEGENSRRLAANVRLEGSMRSFRLTDKVDITQKDIRELQLAKAAMAAGIELLLRRRGEKAGAVERVMLAGAFGNYMSPHAACAIGLIPRELEGRIIPIGNAAGEGAKAAARSGEALRHACKIGEEAGYLELASVPEFQDIFVDNMMF